MRQNIVQSWGQLEAAKANIEATQAQVQASEIALNGVREEARVGQRTTLDVLNAQQELVNARVALVSAQRDRVVASYTLLASVGRLSPQVLGLRVPTYDAARALPAGARQLGRRAHTRRPLKRSATGPSTFVSTVHCMARRSTCQIDSLWRITGIGSEFARLMAVLALMRNRSVSGISGDDADGEGARTLDGGNPCLHPTDHCRRRRG